MENNNMTLESKTFLNIDYRKLENEFNKFLVDNELRKEDVLDIKWNNNVIFMVWENNRESLQQLNKNIDTTRDSAHYVASGCE